MLALGIKLTGEDMARIAAAVGTMAISMMKNAKSFDDFKEGVELARLNEKLSRAMAEMAEAKKDEDKHDDVCES